MLARTPERASGLLDAEPSISRFEMRRLVQADVPTGHPVSCPLDQLPGVSLRTAKQGPSACAVAEKRIFVPMNVTARSSSRPRCPQLTLTLSSSGPARLRIKGGDVACAREASAIAFALLPPRSR